MTVPDLATVEAYHAAVIAAIDDYLWSGRITSAWADFHRCMADRALDRLRRHQRGDGYPTCRHCGYVSHCPDALDAWSDLTALGGTYGVTP
jgi:hypothetical protein